MDPGRREDMQILLVEQDPTRIPRNFPPSRNSWPTTAELDEFLHTAAPGFTAHSLKKGALEELSDAAAQGIIPLTLLGTMARHKRNTEAISPTTMGYLSSFRARLNIAKAMLTHLATQYL